MSILSALTDSAATLSVIARDLGISGARGMRRTLSRDSVIRVGVDIRPFYEPLTGVGWYLHHLLEHLGNRDDIELVLFGDARVTDNGPHLHTTVPSASRMSVFDLRGTALSPLSRPLTAGAYLPRMLLENCDLIFGANYFLPRLMSAVARRRVITIHDLTYKRFPELLQRETLDNLEAEMDREIARADAIICVSEATREDLLHFYDVDPGRVFAIQSGTIIDSTTVDEGVDRLPSRYILFVSTIEPRKDLDTLLRSFEILKSRGEYAGDLVIVGKVGWKSEPTMEAIRRSRWTESIHHLDYLSRNALTSAYRRAEVFVMPSLYEGFGFPILEAMAQGVPVIAANSSSLPEVGGDAAVYFQPRDAEALAASIREVTSDDGLRSELLARGKIRIEQFSWKNAAAQTMKVFHRVAGR